MDLAKIPYLSSSPVPPFNIDDHYSYSCQGEGALLGLATRDSSESSLEGFKVSFREILHVFINLQEFHWRNIDTIEFSILEIRKHLYNVLNINEKQEFATLVRQLANHFKTVNLQSDHPAIRESAIAFMNNFADTLERG